MDAIICESTANENGMKYVAVMDYTGLCFSGTAKFRGDLYSVPYEMEVCGLESLENETTIRSVRDFPYKHPKDKSSFPRVERHYSFPFMAHRMFDNGEERMWKLNKIVMEDKWLADGISHKEIDSIIHDAEYCAEKDVLEREN